MFADNSVRKKWLLESQGKYNFLFICPENCVLGC